MNNTEAQLSVLRELRQRIRTHEEPQREQYRRLMAGTMPEEQVTRFLSGHASGVAFALLLLSMEIQERDPPQRVDMGCSRHYSRTCKCDEWGPEDANG